MRAVAYLLLVSGVGLAAAALLADVIGQGDGAFGTRQRVALALAGLAVAAGTFMLSARLRAWWRSAAPIRPGQCVLLGIAAGFAVGFVEVGHMLGIKKGLEGILLRQPLAFMWMAPLCYAMTLGLVGAVFAFIARLAPSAVHLPAVVFAFALIGLWSQSLLHPRLGPLGLLVLCIGIAAALARAAAARPTLVLSTARRCLPWLAAACALTAVGVGVAEWRTESIAREELPPPVDADPVNVVLIVLDTVRGDHFRMAGYDRDTAPKIDDLARRGVTFPNAISTAPWTLPSHASMFTGHYGHKLSADWLDPLDDEHETLAEFFAAKGYITGGFVGNLVYCLAEQGLGRGFSRYDDFLVTPATFVGSTALGRWLPGEKFTRRFINGNTAETVADRFLDWLPVGEGRPFFAFLNFVDAHAFYECPDKHASIWSPWSDIVFQWYRRRNWTPEQMQKQVDAYDGCIHYIDAQVGRIAERLLAERLLNNTLIVITSDHGELFGEHDLTDHGNSLYRPLLHVPLVFHLPNRWPDRAAVEERVSLRDLAATIATIAGFADHPFPGTSLSHYWRADGASPAPPSPLLSEVTGSIRRPEWEPASRGDMKSLMADGWQYILNGDGQEELYDLSRAPGEEEDRANAEPEQLDKLRRRLQQH
ncbi:MAG: sulfatase [Planctomycetota bacterium]